ncbi:diaminopimelate epimerase [Thermodesulfobacteriota bacterium]
MKSVPFLKYTSYGNNFVIVDESRTPILTEPEKSGFAYQATNINFGVGSDNFLVIQSCNDETLRAIHNSRRYWSELPDARMADYIFRMFEPDGVEAFCCANGLMSIAHYLKLRYGVDSARIMTEVPTACPNVVSIGTNLKNETVWANLCHPRRIPPEIAEPSITIPYDDVVDATEEIKITFRAHDLSPFSQEQSLKISGYLVFTGEPHLVIFVDKGFSQKDLSELLFVSSCQDFSKKEKIEKRANFGTWLIDHIGNYLNRRYAHLFPAGININFVRINQEPVALEYRCFERGINRETLACGTGALAVAFVARRLHLIEADNFILWPHRCRWDDPEGQITVKKDTDGWLLHGTPLKLFEGVFGLKQSISEQKTDYFMQDTFTQTEQASCGTVRL